VTGRNERLEFMQSPSFQLIHRRQKEVSPMRKHSTSLVFLSLFVSCGLSSGIGAQSSVLSNGVDLNAAGLNVRVQFYGETIVRVTKWVDGGTSEKLSLSVIKKAPTDFRIKVERRDGTVLLRSKHLSLMVSGRTGNVEYLTPKGRVILAEAGRPVLTPIVYESDSGYSVRQGFRLSQAEGLYGLGQHQSGYFNYRGKEVVLVQANTEAVNPFLVSTRNYGILWDNYSKTIFEDTPTGASFWSDIGNNIDYYFVSGTNMDEVIAGYRELTGNAPLYGKWAYGYWQSKEHYETQAELMSVAEKYRALKIPIDNMIQDWDYWNGAANWGGMFFDKGLFPRPKEMCDQLHAMNFHIIISIWPALGPNTEVYADMLRHGYLYRPVGWAGFKYYDAYNPAANALYWKYLKRGLYSKGLDGWWMDSTEPDVVNAMTKESSEYELKKMGSNYLGSWARYLNPFSLAMTDAMYRYWREETSDRRAYILTRSTYAGQQRCAATTWSGDIGASWDVYRRQIPAGINHSMSGIPYWTFDIGAFVLGAYDGVFMKGGKDPAYQELYARMFQFGAFCPIFRSHGSETPREVWEMGEFVKPIVNVDNLRYRLMPYIYSLAWMVTDQGSSIMRGLPMDFPSDPRTYAIGDQFMFGPSIMVCPVTDYMYHHPPEPSEPVGGEVLRTADGKPGLLARYFRDADRKHLTREQIDSAIDFVWYTGRPEYVTDSMYAVRWEGKLVPQESGTHQFHLQSYDPKRIILNGDTLRMVYTSVEQYTVPVELKRGEAYDFILETENRSTGAARMRLLWKTPSTFAREQSTVEKEKMREVYLPTRHTWYDFWTGKVLKGGRTIKADAPIDKIPLFVKAGSIVPMGPFLQYSTEKPADSLELRIYPGADGNFTLYEDENDNYNYERGVSATIPFKWNDARRELTIGTRKGSFPGMLLERTINVVLVGKNNGIGLPMSGRIDKVVHYRGTRVTVRM
jgi:alpha-D-xyloside xylohydrolase